MSNKQSRSGIIEVMPTPAAGAHPGSYVVPSFSESGRPLSAPKIVEGQDPGSEVITRACESRGEFNPQLTNNVTFNTIPEVAPEAPVKKGKGKGKGKKKNPAAELPSMQAVVPALPKLTTEPKPSIVVVFNMERAKIRTKVDAVLEAATGLCLVYAEEHDISIQPDAGTELTLTLPGNRDCKVMCLGTLYTWHDSVQKLMPFVKLVE